MPSHLRVALARHWIKDLDIIADWQQWSFRIPDIIIFRIWYLKKTEDLKRLVSFIQIARSRAINCQIYYVDLYVFIYWLKDVELSWLMEKTRAILSQLLPGSALIWHSIELFANKSEILRLVPLHYWYTKLIV